MIEETRDGISTMLMTATSTASDIHNLQRRLAAAFDDLEKPLVRITHEVSGFHNVLKSTSHTAHTLIY